MLTIGATPLLRAAEALDAPAIKLLLAHGALVSLPNIRGTTSTMAAEGLGSVDVVGKLPCMARPSEAGTTWCSSWWITTQI